jgi:hypothetical protein
MRYPPALSFTPARSRVYGAVACIATIILIALCLYSIRANSLFSIKDSVWVGFCACVSAWLLYDAWRAPRGQLVWAQGQWHLQLNGESVAGTLRLHFDLQQYMLVSFVPSAPGHSAITGFFQITTQWFHLEARHVDPAAGPSGWLALRRAVYAAVVPTHEERLA